MSAMSCSAANPIQYVTGNRRTGVVIEVKVLIKRQTQLRAFHTDFSVAYSTLAKVGYMDLAAHAWVYNGILVYRERWTGDYLGLNLSDIVVLIRGRKP